MPDIFGEMVKRSSMAGKELYETFNMGIGFVMATSQPDALKAKLSAMNQPYWVIGHAAKGKGDAVVKTATLDFSC